jgi:hypothetical protein
MQICSSSFFCLLLLKLKDIIKHELIREISKQKIAKICNLEVVLNFNEFTLNVMFKITHFCIITCEQNCNNNRLI